MIDMTPRWSGKQARSRDAMTAISASQPTFARLKAYKTRPRILSLTGCFAEQIGSLMSDHCDVDHLWRVTLPMIAGSTYSGRNFYQSNIADVAERLNYELSRAYYDRIVRNDYDIVLFDTVSEFSNDYFEKDGTIITDITSGLMGENWAWPDGFDLASWNRIRPTDPNYAELYLRSLSEILERKVFGNAKIVLVKRKLCQSSYFSTGFHVIDDSTIEFQSRIIERIQDAVSAIPNVEVIDLGYDSIITDEWAPSGAGKFHPSEEYYVLMLDRVCDHFSIGPDFRSRLMQSAIARIKQRRYAERDGLRTQIADLTTNRETLSIESRALSEARDEAAGRLQRMSAENESLALAAQGANAERERVASEFQALMAARDALIAEVKAVQAERDANAQRIAELQSSHDALSAQHAGEQAEAAKQRQVLQDERNALAAQAHALAAERDEAAMQRDAALADRDRLAANKLDPVPETAPVTELAKLESWIKLLFAEADQGREAQISRVEALVCASKPDLAPLERAVAQTAERVEIAGSVVPALSRQLDQARSEVAQLMAFREKLVLELRFDDGPRALKTVLPLARFIRGTANLLRFRRGG